ncbi:MAG: hypothetical protein E4G98_00055, partial [Promethearchaeota archaeon]
MFDSTGIPHFKIHTHYPTSEAILRHPDLIPMLKSLVPPRIDKENRELLFLYNQYIAQDLYGLKVDFSPTAIIPTPTMRYNFLKHVIQRVSSSKIATDPVRSDPERKMLLVSALQTSPGTMIE